MLAGVNLEPDHLIGLVPPKMGAERYKLLLLMQLWRGKTRTLPVLVAAVKAAFNPR